MRSIEIVETQTTIREQNMTTENDIRLVTFAIEDYVEDNYQFFSTIDRWHAKAVDVVTSDMGLEPAEVEELMPLIIQVATAHNDARVTPGQDYDLAATKDEIYAVALDVARNSSDLRFVDFYGLVCDEVNGSGLIVRGADKYLIEEAAQEYYPLVREVV